MAADVLDVFLIADSLLVRLRINYHANMQQFIDYLAIFAFMAVYFITRDIFLATGILMGGVTLQIIVYWATKRPIGNELKITFWASMIFGGMTLFFRDETFIQWKPTIVNAILASVLIGGHLFWRTFLIKKLLGQVLKIPDENWAVLTYGWAAGFIFAGVLNIWVAYTFSLDTWVTFRFFGLMGLNITYTVLTFVYLHTQGLLTEENLSDPKAAQKAAQTTAEQDTIKQSES